jgi:DNA polymerase
LWLDAELELIRPRIVVALGATAAQALMGRTFLVTKQRGQLLESPWAERFLATVHPSSILRAPSGDREDAYAAFVDDLKRIAKFMRSK